MNGQGSKVVELAFIFRKKLLRRILNLLTFLFTPGASTHGLMVNTLTVSENFAPQVSRSTSLVNRLLTFTIVGVDRHQMQ